MANAGKGLFDSTEMDVSSTGLQSTDMRRLEARKFATVYQILKWTAYLQASVVFWIDLGSFEGHLVVISLRRCGLSDAKRTVGMSCNLKDGLLCAVGQVSRVCRCENSIAIEIYRLPSPESFAVSGTSSSGCARQRGSSRGDNRGRLQMERRTGFSWNVERGNADSRSRVV